MRIRYSLTKIISLLGGELIGNDEEIDGVASLANAGSRKISFFVDNKYSELLQSTKASAIIIAPENRDLTSLPRIISENPYAYFAKLSDLLNPPRIYEPGIDGSAIIGETSIIPSSCTICANSVIGQDVKLGEGVIIGPGCIIGDDVIIGEGTNLQSNVVIYDKTVIGKRCNFSAGVVIGADGFGYANEHGKWIKIPQIGRVIIEDDVDIGANTTVDRGALDDTIIKEGVKLDNLIQVGHNCKIGAHTVIAGCVGIAGSTTIGSNCRIGGAAMILGHLNIAEGTTISPGTMITRTISKSQTYTSIMPFQQHDSWLKTAATIRKLNDMSERVKQLEIELSKLKS